METIYTLIIAGLVGVLLFLVVLPLAAKMLVKKVEHATKLNEDLKENILVLLRAANGEQAARKAGIRDWVLPFVFLLCLGLEVYLLYIHQPAGARITLIGMFLMLVVHVFEAEEESVARIKSGGG